MRKHHRLAFRGRSPMTAHGRKQKRARAASSENAHDGTDDFGEIADSAAPNPNRDVRAGAHARGYRADFALNGVGDIDQCAMREALPDYYQFSFTNSALPIRHGLFEQPRQILRPCLAWR